MVPNQAATRIQGRFSFMDVLLKQYQKVMTNEDLEVFYHNRRNVERKQMTMDNTIFHHSARLFPRGCVYLEQILIVS